MNKGREVRGGNVIVGAIVDRSARNAEKGKNKRQGKRRGQTKVSKVSSAQCIL